MEGLGEGPLTIGKLLPYLVPLLAAAFIIRRNMTARPINVSRLWLLPILMMGAAVLAIASNPPRTTPLVLATLGGALLLGGAIGHQRGRLTVIERDGTTGELTARASVIGMILILAVLGARLIARDFMQANARIAGFTPFEITDAFLLFAVALFSVQRWEVWRKARALAQATPGAPPPAP